MRDLVERLREAATLCQNVCEVDRYLEAADEIERLRKEIDRYKKGLQEVLDHILKYEPKP